MVGHWLYGERQVVWQNRQFGLSPQPLIHSLFQRSQLLVVKTSSLASQCPQRQVVWQIICDNSISKNLFVRR